MNEQTESPGFRRELLQARLLGYNPVNAYKRACRRTGSSCYHPQYARQGDRCLVCGLSIHTPKGPVL